MSEKLRNISSQTKNEVEYRLKSKNNNDAAVVGFVVVVLSVTESINMLAVLGK